MAGFGAFLTHVFFSLPQEEEKKICNTIIFDFISNYTNYIHIKTRQCVVRPKKPARHTLSIFTGRTKTSFSHLYISVITYLIGTTFATQLPASQGSLHSKFEGNRSSHFRDTSCQCFVYFSSFFSSFSSSSFRTLAKIAITSKRVLRSP